MSLVSVVFIILPHSPCRFEDVNAADIVRHVLPDVVVLIISVVSLLFLIYKAFWKKQSSNRSQQQKRQPKDATVSSGDHSINSNPKLEKHSERSKGRSLILQPSSSAYLSVSWSFTFIFLLWLSGVCTASVLNFPYFVSSVYLALCWGLHLNRKPYFLITQRIIIILITLYSSIHLILLYVYQLQSVQDLVPRPSVTARCVCACVRACMCVCVYVCVCVCVCVV